MSNDKITKCEDAIRALGELFSDPKMRAHTYHRYSRRANWSSSRRNSIFALNRPLRKRLAGGSRGSG
jgi:hypothetical protein